MLPSQTLLSTDALAQALEIGSFANSWLANLDELPAAIHDSATTNDDRELFPLRLSDSGLLWERESGAVPFGSPFQAKDWNAGGDELMPFTVLRDQAKLVPKLFLDGLVVIPEGEITVVYGDGGVGKSALAGQLAISAAGGMDFLGGSLSPCPVYVLDFENRRDRTVQRLSGTAAALRVPDSALNENLHVTARADKTLPEILPTILGHIDRYSPGLVVIDGWMQAFAHDTVSAEQVMQAYKQLNAFTARGCTVVILAHVSQSEIRSARTNHRLPEPAGNRQVFNGCRAIYYMDKTGLHPREKNYQVSTEVIPLNRVGTDDAPVFAVASASVLHVPLSESSKSKARKKCKEVDARAAIIAFLTDNGGAGLESDLKRHMAPLFGTGYRQTSRKLQPILDQFQSERQISRVPDEGRHTYRLTLLA